MNIERLNEARPERAWLEKAGPDASGRLPAGRAPQLATFYFAVGIAWLVGGVSLGLVMSASEDFLLRPVHAHVNLLGWVTNALFGCFHWLRGGPALRLHWLGFAAFNIGCLSMLVGLAGLLLEQPVPPGAIPVGAVLVSIAIVQMAATIVQTLRRVSPDR